MIINPVIWQKSTSVIMVRNFAPGKRFGAFPAGSIGYILSEEAFMKQQKVVDYLKFRASVGLVGNDNLGNNRFLFLPDSYDVNLSGVDAWNNNKYGFNFGYNSKALIQGALENVWVILT